MKTQMTLTEMAQELERRKAAKVDYAADSRKLEMKNNGKLAIDGVDDSLNLNQVAHAQLASKLDIPKAYYDRMLAQTPDLLAANVNHWFKSEPKTQLIRTLDNTVRAVLSNRYRRVENEQIAEAVLPILMKEPELRFESIAITEKRLYIKAVLPRLTREVSKGDVVQAGIVISNSEVGMGPISIQPLIFRLVCLNGLIIPDAKFSTRHVGGKILDEENIAALLTDETKAADDNALMLKVRDVTAAAFDEVLFRQNVNNLTDLTTQTITGNPVKAVEVLAKKMNFSESETGSLLKNLADPTSGGMNRWGLLNAVTAMANETEDFDRATELQTLGSKVITLARNEWQEIAMAA